MHETLLIDLSLIIVLGIAAQWIAWRLKIPSILILLVFGFLGGPVTGVLNPDHLFGKLLFPVVSISVALILYEGGLTLKKSEIMAVGGVVRNLISIGLLVTWTLTTLCAYYILALSLPLAILFGAILVVTGPTVILPLLRMIRPRGNINSILKWEGMLNDPIGALLAVLVFESILAGGLREITFLALGGLAKMVLVGGGIGLLTGYLMMTLLRRRLVPEFLQNAVSISLVVFAFAGSNHFQAESGLFAVTLMGIFLANQKKVTVAHIIEFKENLRVLLLSGLFILLAARLERDAFAALGWQGVFFLVALITVVRPAAIFLSTMGSGLNWREKVFLSAMAPRGIVAAAVASLFALQLSQAGFPEAERLVPLTFLVIIGTITLYGLAAKPLAGWLKLTEEAPNGVLVLGAARVGVSLAKALHDAGVKVLLVDTNGRHLRKARHLGLRTFKGNILAESVSEELDLSGLGALLAVTSNQEVNALATLHFKEIFGNDNVYQLGEDEEDQENTMPAELNGRILFGKKLGPQALEERLKKGFRMTSMPLQQLEEEGEGSDDNLNLFAVYPDGDVMVFTDEAENNIPEKEGILIRLQGPSAPKG